MYLEQLKEVNPLTICITNNVVKNFTANGLLALGASPAMSECIEDLEDLLKVANALLINIGTLTKESWQLYQEAIKIANKNQVPVVLDPVAVGIILLVYLEEMVVKSLLWLVKNKRLKGQMGEKWLI